MLKVTCKAMIEQEVIKNLLSAHKRIAASGNAKEVIRLSRFLLRLGEKKTDAVQILKDQSLEDVIEEDRCDTYPEGMEAGGQIW